MIEQDATKVPLPSDEDDFFPHPVCNIYESNVNGVVRNIKTKNHVGYKIKNGYYQFTCRCCSENSQNKKHYLIHRFVFECYFGLIEDKKVIDHINNIKDDNRLENLQAITQKENSKKDAKTGRNLPPIRVKATNIETNETFIYKSIHGASKDLHIYKWCISSVLNGIQNTAVSKKYNERFTFEKLDNPFKLSEIKKVKININIGSIKAKNSKININGKKLLFKTAQDDRR